jgi:ribosomal-protein-alanine N-acetyltransferase
VHSTVPFPQGYGVRPVRLDDADRVAAAYARNREHLAPWDPVRPPEFFTGDGQRDAIARQLSLVEHGDLATWVLMHGDDVVGRVTLNNVVRGVLSSADLGYWVDHGHLRRGLARAAVQHACDRARALGLHRLQAGTLVHNVASQRVLLSAGFERIGIARNYLFIAGRWQDHDLYQRILHDDPPPGQPL